MTKIKDLIDRISKFKTNEKWNEGIKQYALELLAEHDGEEEIRNLEKQMLSGAGDWEQYSWGACQFSLSGGSIPERLFTPETIKNMKESEFEPSFLNLTQTEALKQAYQLIRSAHINPYKFEYQELYEKLYDELDNTTESEKIDIINNFCDQYNYEDYIYNVSDLEIMTSSESIRDILYDYQKVSFSDRYYSIDAYGHPYSYYYADENGIWDIDDLVKAIISDHTDLGNSRIRSIMSTWEENQ